MRTSVSTDNILFLDLHAFYTVCLIVHFRKINPIVHMLYVYSKSFLTVEVKLEQLLEMKRIQYVDAMDRCLV